MEITEVRIKLVAQGNDKLRAFCSITIDHDFVVRDLKIIEGAKGPFVAMPSRKLTQRCHRCGGKNPHRANYCNECGTRLPPHRSASDPGERLKLHADIAHPINSRCREAIQRQVLDHYAQEMEKAKDPNYQPPELEIFDEDYLAGESRLLGESGATGAGPDVVEEPVPGVEPGPAVLPAAASGPMPVEALSAESLAARSVPAEEVRGRRRDFAGRDFAARGFARRGQAAGRRRETARGCAGVEGSAGGREAQDPYGRQVSHGGEGASSRSDYAGSEPRFSGRAGETVEDHFGSSRPRPDDVVRRDRDFRKEPRSPYRSGRDALQGRIPEAREDALRGGAVTGKPLSSASGEVRGRQDSGASLESGGPQRALGLEPPYGPGEPRGERRPPREEVETEPEDNFGAGIFS